MIHYDHDYLPDAGAVSGWKDRSIIHGAGVVALISGYFVLHVMILHAYILRVQSYHDFRDMCAGTSGFEWPALGKAGAAEAHLLPVLRRGVYIGAEAIFATIFIVFVLFFVFDVAFVVFVEYILLFVFLIVSLINLTLGHRIYRVYEIV